MSIRFRRDDALCVVIRKEVSILLQSKVFCSYAPGAGKTTSMLLSARNEEKIGRIVSYDFIYDTGRPLPVEKTWTSRNAHLDPERIISRHPEISVIDELMMKNEFDRKPIYKTVQLLANNGISVFSSTNLIHVSSINRRYRALARIHSTISVEDDVFLQLGKIIFIDPDPDQLLDRYKAPDLFPEHNLEFRFTLSRERLAACRFICLEYLSSLKPSQYEIRHV